MPFVDDIGLSSDKKTAGFVDDIGLLPASAETISKISNAESIQGRVSHLAQFQPHIATKPTPYNESNFQDWYKGWSSTLGLNPNPDDPQHHYDYRAAYKAGATPDGNKHWPSEFKKSDHPNRYVNSIDTITGKTVPTLSTDPGTGIKVPAKGYAPLSKSVELGIKSSAGDFYHVLSNIPGLIDSVENKISEVTGIPKGPTIYTHAEKALKDLAQRVSPTPEEMADQNTLAQKILMAVGSTPTTLGTYALASEAIGPIAGMAVVDALRQVDKGAWETVKGGIKGAGMGAGLAGLGKLPVIPRAGATGALFGGQSALEGGDATDVASSALTGVGLSLMGGRARKPENIADRLPKSAWPPPDKTNAEVSNIPTPEKVRMKGQVIPGRYVMEEPVKPPAGIEHPKIQPNEKINAITLDEAGKLIAKGDTEVIHSIQEGVQVKGSLAMQDAIRNEEMKFIQQAHKGPEREAVRQHIQEIEPEIDRTLRKGEAAPKEPWQITRKEFKKIRNKQNFPSIEKDVPIYEHGKEEPDIVSTQDIVGYFWSEKKFDDYAEIGQTLDNVEDKNLFGGKGSVPSGEYGEGYIYSHRDPLEASMLYDYMGRGDLYVVKGKGFDRINNGLVSAGSLDQVERIFPVDKISEVSKISQDELDDIPNFHENYIQRAISEGKPVPPEVLKDYPELQAKKETEKQQGLFATQESVSKTAKTVDDFIDESISVGMSVKPAKTGTATQGTTSVSPTVEARWQKAKGIQRPPLTGRIRESINSIYHSFRRVHVDLDPKQFPNESEILRQYKTIPEYSKLSAEQVLKGVTAGLDKNQYDIFSRNIILADLVKDIQSGKISESAIPFGYKNLDEVTQDVSKLKAIADASPDIQRALRVRTEFMDTLRRDLVANNLLPENVLNDADYFHRQILEYMALKKPFTGTSSKDVRLHKKGFQMARKGSSLDYNTEYVESEFEVIAQAVSQLETIKTLQKLKATADMSDTLKKQYKGEWKSNIPDGYVLWQPKKGNHFYLTNSITDKVLDDVLSGMKELDVEDIRKALAVGRKRLEWVIPEPLAKTLDNFRDFRDQGVMERFARSSMVSWKQWTLLNPLRVVKYNINNLSGDFDIVMAYKPAIFLESYRAAKDLKSYHMGKGVTTELMTALKKGVIDSGLTVEEIPDIKDIGIFKKLTSGGEPNLIDKYWRTVKGFTTWRENILRLSAYRYFKRELSKGGKLYGASNPAEIDAITDIDDKAAKLARELIGDYGNISQAGQWIRTRMMPFYSWTEINAPRYVRLFRNAPIEGGGYGKMGVAGTLKATRKIAGLTVKSAALYTLINLYNKVRYPEEEKELAGQERRQLHLILGRNEDGTIQTIRIQGALSDALSLFGAEDLPGDVQQVMEGKATWQDKIIDAIEAPAQKLVQGSRPMERAVIESLTGKSLYPDIFQPKPIRDTAEHVAKTLSVDMPYRYIAGKPTRGIAHDIKGLATYVSDPGEIAYFNTKGLISKFLDKYQVQAQHMEPTDKSNALYYFKLAIKYKDKKAQEKYWNKYLALGGTPEGMAKSVMMANPLSALPDEAVRQFDAELSPADRETIKRALTWYQKTYFGGK